MVQEGQSLREQLDRLCGKKEVYVHINKKNYKAPLLGTIIGFLHPRPSNPHQDYTLSYGLTYLNFNISSVKLIEENKIFIEIA